MNIPTQICQLALLSNIGEGHASSETDIEFLLDSQEEKNMNVPFKTTDTAATKVTPVYDASELLGNGSVAKIKLDDKIYTLRLTRQNKLILNK